MYFGPTLALGLLITLHWDTVMCCLIVHCCSIVCVLDLSFVCLLVCLLVLGLLVRSRDLGDDRRMGAAVRIGLPGEKLPSFVVFVSFDSHGI